MTVAVCIKCGAKKHGALTACLDCRFLPTDDDDCAKSIVLTDHHLSESDLDAVGASIRNGEEVQYPEDAITDYTALMKHRPEIDRQIGCFIYGCFFAAIGCIFAVAAFVYWITG